MPKKKYLVDITAEERTTLEHLLRGGMVGTRQLRRARILLKADEGLSDETKKFSDPHFRISEEVFLSSLLVKKFGE